MNSFPKLIKEENTRRAKLEGTTYQRYYSHDIFPDVSLLLAEPLVDNPKILQSYHDIMKRIKIGEDFTKGYFVMLKTDKMNHSLFYRLHRMIQQDSFYNILMSFIKTEMGLNLNDKKLFDAIRESYRRIQIIVEIEIHALYPEIAVNYPKFKYTTEPKQRREKAVEVRENKPDLRGFSWKRNKPTLPPKTITTPKVSKPKEIIDHEADKILHNQLVKKVLAENETSGGLFRKADIGDPSIRALKKAKKLKKKKK